MSRELPVPLLEKFGQRLSPVLVFIGIFAGFSLMVFAGRWAGKQNLFVGYERSYPLISPEGYFYPFIGQSHRTSEPCGVTAEDSCFGRR